VKVSLGFHEAERDRVAHMYWQAFGAKLGRVMGPDARGIGFVRDVLDPDHAICARDETGVLLGVAGFKSYHGALVSGSWADMRRHYGMWGSIWRTASLALLERDTENQRFLMDGIFVSDAARGQGIGTLLLEAICGEARKRGYDAVRLDVIDSNPRARALYLRQGFVAGDVQRLGPLRHLFGFDSATIMIRQI